MKQKTFLCSFVLLCAILISGCKDNIITEETYYGLKYQKAGLLDSIAGDCNTIITRAIPLDSIDFRGVSQMKMTYNAFTDADISFLRLYYVNADTSVNVISLEGSSAISNMNFTEVAPPQSKQFYYVRLGLRSSVCTGHIFHLKLRDVQIYTR